MDGIITSEADSSHCAELLETITAPIIVIGLRDKNLMHGNRQTVFVRNDDEGIGRLAARHLMSLGKLRAYGFVPNTSRSYWSLLRQKGFSAQLREKSLPVNLFDAKLPLREWIESLPKPAAVMAAFDERAMDVLTACDEAGIHVPKQIAVIGVDDDELLCNFSSPLLTSILPNHVKLGGMAAAELDHLFHHRNSHDGQTVLCRTKRLVCRESTAPVSPTSHLVDETLRYIRRNAKSGLTAQDVVCHLGVSRRLIDLRLKEANEPSLAAAITHFRMEIVARLLRETKLPIGQIASACAYDNIQHLANVFKRHYGMTMTTYRSVKNCRSGRNRAEARSP